MYLIDGNNVIGQRVGWHRDKAGSRRRLIDELVKFVRFRKTAVTVVFDGAPDPVYADGSSHRGVRIFYARPGSDADSRIVKLAEAERNRKKFVVVTSDRKLTDRIRVCGVEVMRSGEFRKIIDQCAAMTYELPDPQIRDDEMDEWMRYFGISEDDE